MRRPNFRRVIRLESLESREVMSSGGPSAEAQAMLEMVNLARTNPQAAAAKVTSNLSADVQATVDFYKVDLKQVYHDIATSPVRPPLAWNDQLAAAATGQSNDQAVNGFQSHTGSDGSNVGTRLDRAGYTNRVADGENSYAYAESIDYAMKAFLIDWGVSDNGHRNNIMQPTATPDQFYREVGIGIVQGANPKVGPEVITQDFGSHAGGKAELVGVAYNDKNGNNSYDQGEGQGNVEVDATNAAGQTVSTRTWDNGGGYQIALDPGQYTIQARVNGNVVKSDNVTVGTQNLQIDYNLTALGSPAPVSNQAAQLSTSNSTPVNPWSSWTV